MITFYSVNNCKYCKIAKQWLQDNNIDYREINLSEKENRDARKFYRDLGINTAPVIIGIRKNGTRWIVEGFDDKKKDTIKRFINE